MYEILFGSLHSFYVGKHFFFLYFIESNLLEPDLSGKVETMKSVSEDVKAQSQATTDDIPICKNKFLLISLSRYEGSTWSKTFDFIRLCNPNT